MSHSWKKRCYRWTDGRANGQIWTHRSLRQSWRSTNNQPKLYSKIQKLFVNRVKFQLACFQFSLHPLWQYLPNSFQFLCSLWLSVILPKRDCRNDYTWFLIFITLNKIISKIWNEWYVHFISKKLWRYNLVSNLMNFHLPLRTQLSIAKHAKKQ